MMYKVKIYIIIMHPSDFNDVKVYNGVKTLNCCNGKHKKTVIKSREYIEKILKNQAYWNRYPSASQRKSFMKF